MKKILLFLTIVAMLCSMVVGCSPASDADTSEGDGAEAPAIDPNKEYELTIWHHEPNAQRELPWTLVIEAFEKEYPNIKVTTEAVLWADYQPKLINAIQTSTAPDLTFNAETTWASAYQVDGLVPMDDVYARIDAAYDYYEGCAAGYTVDGHKYCVPYITLGELLFYRPSMLEEAGIDAPPTTWAEFVEQAEKLTVDKDGDGQIDQYGVGISAVRLDLTENTYAALMATTGSDVFDAEGNPEINTQDHIDTLKLYGDLYKYTSPAANGWGWGEVEMNWPAGTFALFPYPSPVLPAFFSEENYDIAAAPLPTPDGKQDSHISMNQGLSITKDCVDRGNMAAAEAFVEFMFKPENHWLMTVCSEPGLFFPTTQACNDMIADGYMVEEYFPLENYDHTEGSPTREIFDSICAAAAETLSVGFPFGAKYGPVNANFASMYGAQLFTDMVIKVCLEGATPEEAAEWAQQAMEDMNE
jgi:multiple sugar transport system substrate-binding protein